MNQADLDLAEQDETESLAHTLTITNRSRSGLVLGKVVTDCACVQVAKLEGKRLEPGESVALPLKLKLFAPAQAGLSKPHAFDSVLEIQTDADGEKGSASWTITAMVRRALRLSASSLDFGTVSHYDRKAEAVMDVLAAPGIEALKADAGTPWLTTVTRTPTGFRVAVRPRGEWPSEIRGDLRLVPLRGGKELPAREAPLAGRVVEDVQPTAPIVHFGRRATGTKGEESVSLRSLTGRPFKVLEAKGTGGMEVRREGERFALSITFGKTGDAEEDATFLVEDAKGRKFRLAVPVRWFGY